MNKMRSGEKITLSQNYTGKLIESSLLTLDENINRQNEGLIQKYWKESFGGKVKGTDKGWIIEDVDFEIIAEFLTRFKSHSGSVKQKALAIDYLTAISDKFPKGDVLLISKGPGEPEKFELGAQDRTAEDATREKWQVSGYRVASRGDEKLGLSDPQIEAARELAARDEKSKSKKPSDFHYRVVRDKPLLMVHVLEPDNNPEFKGARVPAWGLSYPDGQYKTAIEVVANRAWIEQMYGSLEDDREADEDYDDE
jgi:hypothetical protein